MSKLDELREKIDVCDKILAETLEKRMKIVLEIMQEKKELGIPIFSEERESEIIQRIGKYINFPEFEEEIKEIHTHILKSCRRIQSRRLFPYHISIVGFMGSGKTTVGQELSRMVAMDLIDIDKVIEDRTKMTISQIFSAHGEAYFRELEQKTVEELYQDDNTIVFCSGGGVVLDNRNVEIMKKNGVVIWLKASASVIYKRISKETTRPLLNDAISVEKIEHMLSTRLPLYENAADMVIETDNKTAEEVSLEIVKKLMRLSNDETIKLTE